MADFKALGDLYEIIKDRRDNGDPETSYTAKLFSKGRKKIAQKLGEEAVETVIEAIADNKKEAISESSDLLYHLLVLWVDMDIKPEKVIKELEKRTGVSGLDEKKARKKA